MGQPTSSESKGKRIIIVDDDRVLTNRYQQRLVLAGFLVRPFFSVGTFMRAFRMGNLGADLYIIDVMMPGQDLYSEAKTDNGMNTGLCLASDIRDKDLETPIILFSNDTFDLVAPIAKKLALRLSNCYFVRKIDTPPDALTDLVERYFATGSFEAAGQKPPWFKRLFRRLFGSLLLQPNFGGLGIDLKELTKRDDLGT